MQYMDVRKAAQLWDWPERKVTRLCRAGRITGAVKEAGNWWIPENTPAPTDMRHNRGKKGQAKLPLPIGVSDFKELITNYYYVDKTLLIKDFIDNRPKVSLFTRPRRFGKTLAMDMLKTYFEISEVDTSHYFKNLNIWACGEAYRSEQGKYPVIAVTFKDIKYDSWEKALEAIHQVIAKEYRRHIYLLESSHCNAYDKKYFESLLDGEVSEVALANALANLAHMLKSHYGVPAIIIIDEYDTPIQQGYMSGYYNQIIAFMRNLFSGAFKDNRELAFGFLTGILRVAKESIFSGLNNLKVNSILEDRYSEYFGFTEAEILSMMEHYGKADKVPEVCDWYDGYRFGDTDIFNPWSVLNYLDESCTPKAYWQSTGDNSIIRQIVSQADEETAENLHKLMQGQTISSYIDTSVIYPEITNDPTTIYSFLLAAGYLKTVAKASRMDDSAICDIAIPNKEIFYVYEREILSAMSDKFSQSTAIAVQQAIMTQNIPMLQKQLQKLLVNTISSFDYAQENFYHGLVLGICAVMNNLYRVTSNREAGLGRYDIQLKPIQSKTLPGIIIELKVVDESVPAGSIEEKLEKSAAEALDQIDRKQYVNEMKQEGISSFLKIGIAFHKKQVTLKSAAE